MPTPYYLNPKATKLPEGHDDTLDPSEEPTDSAVRVLAPNTWPVRDTSPGPKGPRDRPAGHRPTDPARRSLPPFEWPRFANLIGLPEPDLDPDIALWPVDIVNRWPFTGPPTTGVWPTGWMSVDNTATVWVCIAGGSPGTWAPLAPGGTAVFTPDQFGAVGDGVTDDSLALQAAINAASAAAAGPGTYGVVQGVRGKTYAVTYGQSITLIFGGVVNAGVIMRQNVVMEYVNIVAPYVSTGQTCIVGVPNFTNNWNIHHCTFNANTPLTSTAEILNYAVYGGTCNNATFSDNYVQLMGGGACRLGDNSGQVCQWIRYERNFIQHVNSNPLKINFGVNGWYIRDNYILDSIKMTAGYNAGGSTESILATGGAVSNVICSGNYIRDFQGPAISTPAGLLLENVTMADNVYLITSLLANAGGLHGPAIGSATSAGPVTNAIIRNNMVDMSQNLVAGGSTGLGVTLAGTNVTNFAITGNTIIAAGQQTGTTNVNGISISSTASSFGVINGNSITNLPNPFTIGINIQNSAGGCFGAIADNVIAAIVGGTTLNAPFGLSANTPMTITGNTLINCNWNQTSFRFASRIADNVGYNPYGGQNVAVPTSGSQISWVFGGATSPLDNTLFVTASTSTVTFVIAPQPGPLGGGTQPSRTITIPASSYVPVRVPAGCTVTVTYTAAPTWLCLSD